MKKNKKKFSVVEHIEPIEKHEKIEKDELDEMGYQPSFNLNQLRNETELFNEECDIEYKTISVKRVTIKNEEEWRIIDNGKVVLVLSGSRFAKREKEFLRTVEGVQFLLNGAKEGWKSVAMFKNKMR